MNLIIYLVPSCFSIHFCLFVSKLVLKYQYPSSYMSPPSAEYKLIISLGFHFLEIKTFQLIQYLYNLITNVFPFPVNIILLLRFSGKKIRVFAYQIYPSVLHGQSFIFSCSSSKFLMDLSKNHHIIYSSIPSKHNDCCEN